MEEVGCHDLKCPITFSLLVHPVMLSGKVRPTGPGASRERCSDASMSGSPCPLLWKDGSSAAAPLQNSAWMVWLPWQAGHPGQLPDIEWSGRVTLWILRRTRYLCPAWEAPLQCRFERCTEC